MADTCGGRAKICTIITTTPNELMADIHDRMPMILGRDNEALCLDNDLVNPHLLKSLLIPYGASLMRAYEITSLAKMLNWECFNEYKKNKQF